MIPGEFEYHAPSSVQDAVALLAKHRDEAKILAGGQSLIPAMRFRLAAPEILIDLNGIGGLDQLEEQGSELCIGAMTRESALEESDLVQKRYPLLADAAAVIADPVVRNMATVGGNVAHADPANDHPAVMLAYGATVYAEGPKGKRSIAIDDFFLDLFENALEIDEILTELRIPAPTKGSGGAYMKLERKVGDYAISGVAVQLVMDGSTCKDVRIGLTNVSPAPMRAKNAEQELIGKAVDAAAIAAAAKAAAGECDPSADLRGGVDYKRDMTRVLTERALVRAVERSKE
ncbi:MAG: xanthine dehydrogenase family protein subunit M [Myxococcales bacterium]|nr:xanthine dehydrogenase family protein subunit M [Myxococcales bacterium]